MSIGLLVAHADARKEDRLVPVASDAVFAQHWKPVAARLSLRWVLRFQTGWVVAAEDMTPLLRELSQLRRHLADLPHPGEMAPHVIARASRLSRELHEVMHTPQAYAFLGPVGLPLLRRTQPMPLLAWVSSVTSAASEPPLYDR